MIFSNLVRWMQLQRKRASQRRRQTKSLVQVDLAFHSYTF